MALVSLALLAALAGTGASAASADGIDAYRWRARLLVVVAPDPRDPRLAAQRRSADRARAGMRERDLVTVIEAGANSRADALRRRFSIPPDAFRAILVGKDGGAKLESAEPIAPERLFAEIDAMPMRQDEMRRQGARR